MHTYISRTEEGQVLKDLKIFPAVAILGPRQCGKSTMVKKLQSKMGKSIYIDLEKPTDQRKLTDPELFLESNKEHIIILDEIQRQPNLFPVLRSIIDEQKRNGRFILLGSASRDLIKQSSETLAGRISYLELTPLMLPELIGQKNFSFRNHWLRGGFPRSFLTTSNSNSLRWRESFIQSFLERDIPQLGFSIPAKRIHRLWMMCAHNHAQTLNSSKLSDALGVSANTVQSYIELLSQTFMLRILPAYASNLKKRLVKAPKIYIRDSGILHALLSIDSFNTLLGHPILGSSWEGYAIETIIRLFPEWEASYYRTSNGTELDLILEKGTKKMAFECKYSSQPSLSKGFYSALADLHIKEATVITPLGSKSLLSKGVTISSLQEYVLERGQ